MDRRLQGSRRRRRWQKSGQRVAGQQNVYLGTESRESSSSAGSQVTELSFFLIEMSNFKWSIFKVDLPY